MIPAPVSSAPQLAQGDASWLAIAAHAVAVGSALLALPAQLFSPLWLLLFSLPGALFLLLSRHPATRRRTSFVERLALAVLMQLGLSFAIFQTPAAPVDQAALTYLLLAPLAYSTLRRNELDVLHSLFLSFCLLLIGCILRSQAPLPQVTGFVVGAALLLQIESPRAAEAATRPHEHHRARLLDRAGITLACLLAFLGLYQALQGLPALRRPDQADGAGAGRQVGVSTRFELGGALGGPLNLIDDELVTVHSDDGDAPTDLYLRCGYFDVAGLDSWSLNEWSARTHDLAAGPWRRRPVRGAASTQLVVERVEGLSGFVYLPPGTVAVSSTDPGPALLVNDVLEFARERAPAGPIRYRVRYQDLAPLAGARDVTAPIPGLTALPASLARRRELVSLAAGWTRGANGPGDVARRIARGLQQRCSYTLEGPQGDSPHALDNFLFGNRQGYCMHFSSAMAILLRLRGVPCRIAVGLFGGTRGSDPGERLFGSRHAHAWVELPLRGLGWVVFDPTPAAVLADQRQRWPDPVAAGAQPDIEPEDAAAKSDAERDRDARAWRSRLSTAAPWFGLLALMLMMLLRPRTAATAPIQHAAVRQDARLARQLLDRLCAALASRGRPRAPGVPLETYLASLRRDPELDARAVHRAFRAYQDVRFGGQPLTPTRRAALVDAVQDLR